MAMHLKHLLVYLHPVGSPSMVQEIFASVGSWSIPVQSMVAVFSSTALVQEIGAGKGGEEYCQRLTTGAQQNENVIMKNVATLS